MWASISYILISEKQGFKQHKWGNNGKDWDST
jgi:hypothetical protein